MAQLVCFFDQFLGGSPSEPPQVANRRCVQCASSEQRCGAVFVSMFFYQVWIDMGDRYAICPSKFNAFLGGLNKKKEIFHNEGLCWSLFTVRGTSQAMFSDVKVDRLHQGGLTSTKK